MLKNTFLFTSFLPFHLPTPTYSSPPSQHPPLYPLPTPLFPPPPLHPLRQVDIDIKLRSCKGSCKGYAEFSVDQASYVALDKQMDQLESQSVPSVETVSTLYVMKSRPLKDVVVDR